MLTEAEAKAAGLIDNAQVRAAEIDRDGAARAQAHADNVLAESQSRLDELMATERRAHERLCGALAELQVAVDLLGGEAVGDALRPFQRDS